MTALDEWRLKARALIPRGFLRRDRGDGLLISDYPRYPDGERVTAALMDAGFRVRVDGQMAILGLSPSRIDEQAGALTEHAPAPTDETLFLWALAQRIVRQGGPAAEADLPAIYLTLKLLDAGELSRLEKTLSPLSALAQRTRHSLPAAIGQMILAHLNA